MSSPWLLTQKTFTLSARRNYAFSLILVDIEWQDYMKTDPSSGHSSSLVMSCSPFFLIHFFHLWWLSWWHIDRWHGADSQNTTEHHPTAQMMVQAEQWSVHFTALWVMGASVPHSRGPVQPIPRKSQVHYMIKWIYCSNFVKRPLFSTLTAMSLSSYVLLLQNLLQTGIYVEYRQTWPTFSNFETSGVSSSIKTSQSRNLFFNLAKNI